MRIHFLFLPELKLIFNIPTVSLLTLHSKPPSVMVKIVGVNTPTTDMKRSVALTDMDRTLKTLLFVLQSSNHHANTLEIGMKTIGYRALQALLNIVKSEMHGPMCYQCV